MTKNKKTKDKRDQNTRRQDNLNLVRGQQFSFGETPVATAVRSEQRSRRGRSKRPSLGACEVGASSLLSPPHHGFATTEYPCAHKCYCAGYQSLSQSRGVMARAGIDTKVTTYTRQQGRQIVNRQHHV